MTLKSDAKFEEKTICCLKNDKNFGNFDPSSQVSKTCTLIGLFRAKYITFDLKKYRGVIFHDTEVTCKIWRKINLWFGKWHEEFGKLSPEHCKVSKLGLLWDPFVQSRKCMSLKFTRALCLMTMKNDTKIEEELICCFKIDMRNLTNFDPVTQKSSKFTLWMSSFRPAYIIFEIKNTEELSFMALKNDTKFDKKLSCGLKNDMRNLAYFYQITLKCQNWNFHGVLLPKVENVWA